MSLKRGFVIALRSLLAMSLGSVVVALVNQGGGELADLAGFSWGGGRRLAWDLAWVFIAGVLAAWTVVRLAPCAPRAHAVAFFVLMLVVAVVAVMQLGNDWPRWFGAGVLLALPLQAWLGAWWALRGGSRETAGRTSFRES